MKYLQVFFFLVLLANAAAAQTAKELFEKKEYSAAALAYEKMVVNDPVSYLNLGKCYLALLEFDKAAEAMVNYRDKYPGADKKYWNQVIAILEQDADLIKIDNLGPVINNTVDEAVPRISQDGKTLYFKSIDRTGGCGGEDIWRTTKDTTGTWKQPVNITQLNTTSHEALMSISADDNVAILFGNYTGSFGDGDLFYSVRREKGWTLPCNLGGTINSEKWEAQANLGPDGLTLFFCSNRAGGQGANDIYVSQLTSTGWTKPANLGPVINTSDNDGRPFLAADGKTLYFASAGHPGLGRMDMFMSKKTGNSWTEWSEPVNLGKYFNTIEDDEDLAVPASAVRGYTVKSNLPDGVGNADIYSFVLPYEMRPEPVFQVYGTVQDDQGGPVGAIIHFKDIDNNQEIAMVTSRLSDGMYRVALPALRRYAITIDMKAYLSFSDLLDLRNPDEMLKKQTMQSILEKELENIRKARARYEEFGTELDTLLNQNSPEILDAFSNYQKVARQYRDNSRNLELYIKRAKMDWLSQENEGRELRRDYTLQPIKVGSKLELKNIYFDFGKATLRKDSEQELDKLYDLLQRVPMSIEIGGHTDNVGNDDANLKLSQARVDEVKKYMVENKKIAANRIAAVGYGEQFPIAGNETEEVRAKNRRVELKITSIAEREGTDEYKEEEDSKFDMLSLLYHAAKVGGLPKDSPCAERSSVMVVQTTEPPQASVASKASKAPVKTLEIEDNIFDEISLNYLFAGVENKGSMHGVGYITCNEDNLNEFHLGAYYSKSNKLFGLNTARIYPFYLGNLLSIDLSAIVGVDFDLWVFPTIDVADPSEEIAETGWFLSVPLGARYFMKTHGVILGYDAIYNLAPLGTDGSSFLKVGVNARKGILQGGAFMNLGGPFSLIGLRLGATF